jgi:hypothetical protein
MERLPAHAGIGKDFVGFLGGDDNRLSAGDVSDPSDKDDDDADADHLFAPSDLS